MVNLVKRFNLDMSNWVRLVVPMQNGFMVNHWNRGLVVTMQDRLMVNLM